MKRSASKLRWSALLGAGALVMHELQYRVGFGAGADTAPGAHGHAYLSWALALVVVLGSLAAVRLLAEIGGARRGRLTATRRHRPSFSRGWACASGALAATYLLQEGLEGALSAGHPGLDHIVGAHRGWLILLVAVALGALIAFLVRGADAIVAIAARAGGARRRRRPCRSFPRPPARLRGERLEVLARHLAGRAPPASCS